MGNSTAISTRRQPRFLNLRSFDAWALLVWTFRDQKARAEAGRGLLPVARDRDDEDREGQGGGIFDDIATLGCRVEGGGFDRGELHPAAEAVVAFVQDAFEGHARRTLIAQARAGQAPELLEGRANPMIPDWGAKLPRHDRDGRPEPSAVPVLLDPVARRPFLCPVRPRFADSYIRAARERYTDWWLQVAAVDRHFRRSPQLLPGVSLLPWTRPADPWAESPRSGA